MTQHRWAGYHLPAFHSVFHIRTPSGNRTRTTRLRVSWSAINLWELAAPRWWHLTWSRTSACFSGHIHRLPGDGFAPHSISTTCRVVRLDRGPGGSRTPTSCGHLILSQARLPISPQAHLWSNPEDSHYRPEVHVLTSAGHLRAAPSVWQRPSMTTRLAFIETHPSFLGRKLASAPGNVLLEAPRDVGNTWHNDSPTLASRWIIYAVGP